MTDPVILAQILWTSLAGASFQVLFTIAFALVLKVVKVWNFTQPGLMGIAFYAIYASVLAGLPAGVAVALSLGVTAAAAWAIERFAFRTLRKRRSEPITFFIFTFIFSQFVIFTLTLIFTTEPRFMLDDMFSPIRLVGGVVVSDWDLRAVAVTVAMVAGLYGFVRFTRPGQFMLAVADNADLAEIYGISKNAYYGLTMAIAAVFITVAMYVFGGKLALYPELTLHIMIFAVAATILGGIGNVFAAAAAAVAINVLQQLSVLVVDSRWQPLLVFAILFVAIVFFPSGVRLPRRLRADGRAPAAAAAAD